MRLLLPLLASLLIFPCVVEGRDFRTLTNTKGQSIEAEILEMPNEETVKIRARSQVFEVPLDSLSEEDQNWLAEWRSNQGGSEDMESTYTELIFEDDFESDGFKEGWGHYKSESVVADGVLIGKTIDIKDHAGVDNVRFEGRQDLEIRVKFNFMSDEAERFNVWMDDKDYKGSHAGHICSVAISPTGGSVSDAKTGNFENEIYAKRKSGAELDEATKELLATKTEKFELSLDREAWHTLLIQTMGPMVTVTVNDEVVVEFESVGNAHPTKSLVSLTTNINDVHYDDFSVRASEVD